MMEEKSLIKQQGKEMAAVAIALEQSGMLGNPELAAAIALAMESGATVQVPDEMIAAIALSMHLSEGRDVLPAPIIAAITLVLSPFISGYQSNEKAILTINRVERTYSPWSSKIYGLRQLPNYIPRKFM
ncbi:MAG: hypothetical protein V2A54_07095 [Bacteroidota bacterium]